MKNKAVNELTKEEKEWMDTLAVNYIIAQSDGFQLGYSQAINDFTDYIIDYWQGSDDKPQKSVLDALVDIGVELGRRKKIAKKNIETAEKDGYERYYNWEFKKKDEPFTTHVNLFTRDFAESKESELNEASNDKI